MYFTEKLNIMISDTKQAQRCIKLQKGDVTIGSSVSASNESYSVEVKASTNTIIITGKDRPGKFVSMFCSYACSYSGPLAFLSRNYKVINSTNPWFKVGNVCLFFVVQNDIIFDN